MSLNFFFRSTQSIRAHNTHKLSNPRLFLWSMLIFIVLISLISLTLTQHISAAFLTNPGLNGLILGVLAIGIILSFVQILQLFREVYWVNSFQEGSMETNPVFLLPMKVMLSRSNFSSFSATSMKTMLDSIANRLDESRDILRYLIGLLVFLGLLGTFWGLLGTINSIQETISLLDPSSENTQSVLNTLKSGLSAPLSGMGTAFSSSLFGLSGSLILGFLDLQAGRAQNRFYTELENWLSTETDLSSDTGRFHTTSIPNVQDFGILIEKIHSFQKAQDFGQRTTIATMANLTESISGLIKNMLAEQQVIRNWMETQSEERKNLQKALQKIADCMQEKRHH